MSDTKEIKIKIDNHSYILKVRSQDEVFYYEKLANYVDETIQNIKSKINVKEYKNMLILSCLSLADEIMCGSSAIGKSKVVDNSSIIQERLSQILEKIKSSDLP